MRPIDKEEELRTEHKEFIHTNIEGSKTVGSGKINRICEAMKEELVKRNENNHYLLPILTIYIKK